MTGAPPHTLVLLGEKVVSHSEHLENTKADKRLSLGEKSKLQGVYSTMKSVKPKVRAWMPWGWQQ